MHHHYSDIRSRIAEAPKWWDEQAVPRYCDFGPDETADIYVKECALVEIKCQSCGTPFRVAFSWNDHEFWHGEDKVHVKLIPPMTLERVKQLHYGDPPNAGCCDSGPTMNSEPQRVLEFWRKDDHFKWVRVPELEVAIDCEWAAAPEGP